MNEFKSTICTNRESYHRILVKWLNFILLILHHTKWGLNSCLFSISLVWTFSFLLVLTFGSSDNFISPKVTFAKAQCLRQLTTSFVDYKVQSVSCLILWSWWGYYVNVSWEFYCCPLRVFLIFFISCLIFIWVVLII